MESSSKGTKAQAFKKQFSNMLIPDFQENLAKRMARLDSILQGYSTIIMVGSSYGGLMASLYAAQQPKKNIELILLAPALNFPEFSHGPHQTKAKTTIFHGVNDTVCPHNTVLSIAKEFFTNLTFNSVNDDHALTSTFRSIPWKNYLT